MKNSKLLAGLGILAIIIIIVALSVPPSLIQTLTENKKYLYATIGIGSSMEPTILNGDTIIILSKTSPGYSISIGEILVYHQENLVVAHRVFFIGNGFYRVKGDNAPTINTVYEEDVIGKVANTVNKNNIIGNALVNSLIP
jgi:signal peptidase I